jgi:hypothetical protein
MNRRLHPILEPTCSVNFKDATGYTKMVVWDGLATGDNRSMACRYELFHSTLRGADLQNMRHDRAVLPRLIVTEESKHHVLFNWFG